MNTTRSSVGKIGRLPFDIRTQLNQRLLDGQPAKIILPWLNELPQVKEVLNTQFNGAPIKRQNLDKWRRLGFQRWFKQQQPFLFMHNLGKRASKTARSDHGSLARGSAALVSGEIFDHLHSAESGKHSINDILKMASAIKPFLAAEQNDARLKLLKKRIRQEDNYQLLRDMRQHDTGKTKAPIDTPEQPPATLSNRRQP